MRNKCVFRAERNSFSELDLLTEWGRKFQANVTLKQVYSLGASGEGMLMPGFSGEVHQQSNGQFIGRKSAI